MKRFILFISIALCSLSLFAKDEEAVNPQGNTQSGVITKTDDCYVLNGKTMTKDAYLEFIKQNCVVAWESYQKGQRLWKAGWGLLGAGIGTSIIGITLMCVGDNQYVASPGANPAAEGMFLGGALTLGLGAGMMAGSIPCLIVGGIKRNNSHEVYNEVNGLDETAVTFGIRPAQNGLAVVMNF